MADIRALLQASIDLLWARWEIALNHPDALGNADRGLVEKWTRIMEPGKHPRPLLQGLSRIKEKDFRKHVIEKMIERREGHRTEFSKAGELDALAFLLHRYKFEYADLLRHRRGTVAEVKAASVQAIGETVDPFRKAQPKLDKAAIYVAEKPLLNMFHYIPSGGVSAYIATGGNGTETGAYVRVPRSAGLYFNGSVLLHNIVNRSVFDYLGYLGVLTETGTSNKAVQLRFGPRVYGGSLRSHVTANSEGSALSLEELREHRWAIGGQMFFDLSFYEMVSLQFGWGATKVDFSDDPIEDRWAGEYLGHLQAQLAIRRPFATAVLVARLYSRAKERRNRNKNSERD